MQSVPTNAIRTGYNLELCINVIVINWMYIIINVLLSV